MKKTLLVSILIIFCGAANAADTYPVCGLRGARDLQSNRDKWADSSRFKITPTAQNGATYIDSFFFAGDKYEVTFTADGSATVAEVTTGMVAAINVKADLSDSVTAEDSTTYYVVRPQRINTWDSVNVDANQTVTGNRTIDTLRMVINIFAGDDSTGVPAHLVSDSNSLTTTRINECYDSVSIFWLVDYNVIYSDLLSSKETVSGARQVAAIAPDSQLNVWIASAASGASFDTSLGRKNILNINSAGNATGTGETISHEVGHFLSLWHTGLSVDTRVCDSCYEYAIGYGQNDSMRNRTGDGIEDTPPDMTDDPYVGYYVGNESSKRPDSCSDIEWSDRYPVTSDTVQAGTDDGSKSPSGWGTDDTISYLGVDDTTYISAIRFPSIALASGDSMPFAQIGFQSQYDVEINSGEIVVDVVVQLLSASDPAGAVLSTFANLEGRNWSVDTAQLIITTSNWPLVDDVRYKFVGFRGLVQKAIAAANWDSGDALVFKFVSHDSSDGFIKYHTYDESSTDGPTLVWVKADTETADRNYLNLMSSPRRSPTNEYFSEQQGWRMREWLNGPFVGWKAN